VQGHACSGGTQSITRCDRRRRRRRRSTTTTTPLPPTPPTTTITTITTTPITVRHRGELIIHPRKRITQIICPPGIGHRDGLPQRLDPSLVRQDGRDEQRGLVITGHMK
jgi:hypothetical protein